MRVLLRLNEGFADLSGYDAVKVIERVGHRLLIGEKAGQLIEHVVAFFDRQPENEPDKPTALLDRIGELVVQTYAAGQAETLIYLDARELTIAPTDHIQADLMSVEAGGSEDEAPPSPTAEQPAMKQERIVIRLRRDASTPKEIFLLKGRRVTEVQVAGEGVGLICEAE